MKLKVKPRANSSTAGGPHKRDVARRKKQNSTVMTAQQLGHTYAAILRLVFSQFAEMQVLRSQEYSLLLCYVTTMHLTWSTLDCAALASQQILRET